jgi:hypothetical protein
MALGPGMSALGAALAVRLGEAAEGLSHAAEAARGVGTAASAAAIVAGLLLLTVAARFRRVLAGVGGAAIGALAALAAHGAIASAYGLSIPLAAALGAVVLGAASALFPPVYPLAAGALPGALLGAHVPIGGRAALGAAVGGLVAGLVALAFATPIGIAVASFVGGLAIGLGLVGVLSRHAVGLALAAHPFALLAVAVVLGVAGSAFQLGRGEPRARALAPPDA